MGGVTPQERYQVCDPDLREFVDAFSRRHDAFNFARLEAERRGWGMEVFDRMAQYRKPQIWRVAPTGEVSVQSYRKAES